MKKADVTSMRDLAGAYWDRHWGASLEADGVPPRERRVQRRQYVRDVLADPTASRLLHVWGIENAEIDRDVAALMNVPYEGTGREQPLPPLAEEVGLTGPILVGYNFDEPNQRYVTATGKVLSEEELQAYVSTLEEPELCRWDVHQKFRVTRGQLGLAGEQALYAEGVRREIHGGAFRWACSLDATHSLVAQAHALTLLTDLLQPYDVGIFVYDVRLVCLGMPK